MEVDTLIKNIGIITVIKKVYMCNRNYLMVATQQGKIYKINLKNKKSKLFLDISDKIFKLSPDYDERGLLGMAFPDNFEKNKIFYLYYSTNKILDLSYSHFNVVERYKYNGHSWDTKIIISIGWPFSNHNGINNLLCYKDKLLLATGDGGSEFDPLNLAQNIKTYYGKILSICLKTSKVKILAMGLRNPLSFIIDKDARNSFYVCQAGQESFEAAFRFKLNYKKIINFGWRAWEGPLETTLDDKVIYRNESVKLINHYPTITGFPTQKTPNLTSVMTAGTIYKNKFIYSHWFEGELYYIIPIDNYFCYQKPNFIYKNKNYFTALESDNKFIYIGMSETAYGGNDSKLVVFKF